MSHAPTQPFGVHMAHYRVLVYWPKKIWHQAWKGQRVLCSVCVLDEHGLKNWWASLSFNFLGLLGSRWQSLSHTHVRQGRRANLIRDANPFCVWWREERTFSRDDQKLWCGWVREERDNEKPFFHTPFNFHHPFSLASLIITMAMKRPFFVRKRHAKRITRHWETLSHTHAIYDKGSSPQTLTKKEAGFWPLFSH